MQRPRPVFSRKRRLLGEPCHIVERLLAEDYSSTGVEGRPGLILFVQTFGDLVTFNPHIHVLAADGVFGADGTFTVLPAIPAKLLELGFRSEVFKLLVSEGALLEDAAVLRRILEHWGLWAPRQLAPSARSPPARQPDADVLTLAPNAWTYHPVPDIA